MNLIKTLLITSLVMVFTGSYAQCAQKIELIRTSEATPETHGEFTLKIKGDYAGQLIMKDGVAEKAVKSFNGTGTSSIKLTKLSTDHLYQVVVEFKNEEKFLCKRKVVLIPTEGE